MSEKATLVVLIWIISWCLLVLIFHYFWLRLLGGYGLPCLQILLLLLRWSGRSRSIRATGTLAHHAHANPDLKYALLQLPHLLLVYWQNMVEVLWWRSILLFSSSPVLIALLRVLRLLRHQGEVRSLPGCVVWLLAIILPLFHFIVIVVCLLAHWCPPSWGQMRSLRW